MAALPSDRAYSKTISAPGRLLASGCVDNARQRLGRKGVLDFPATVMSGRTFSMSTAPALTTACDPISTSGTIAAPVPTNASLAHRTRPARCTPGQICTIAQINVVVNGAPGIEDGKFFNRRIGSGHDDGASVEVRGFGNNRRRVYCGRQNTAVHKYLLA